MNEVCQKAERETIYPQGIVHFANPVPTVNDIGVINFDILLMKISFLFLEKGVDNNVREMLPSIMVDNYVCSSGDWMDRNIVRLTIPCSSILALLSLIFLIT